MKIKSHLLFPFKSFLLLHVLGSHLVAMCYLMHTKVNVSSKYTDIALPLFSHLEVKKTFQKCFTIRLGLPFIFHKRAD